MGKAFELLRGLIFVLILGGVLAWVPVQLYKGDIITSLLISAGMFVSSVILALLLMFIIKRD